MDRLEIERQLQRDEQIAAKAVHKLTGPINFWNFNSNYNSHIFIKALFLLLL